jgi:hypothetical protein
MIKRPTPFVNNPGTTPDHVLRDVSDLYGKSIRVSDASSVVESYYSHFRVTYNGTNPTRVKYYHGTEARRTTFTLGMADTLGGKYFKIYTAPDNHLHTVWFNLDGVSIQPSVPNTHAYIEIPVETGDEAALVCIAIKMVLDGLYSNYFYAYPNETYTRIEIITSQMGECNASDSGTTGFIMSQVAGAQNLVQDIEISYQGNDPFYNGELLKGYQFDIYSGKFVKNPAISIGAISTVTVTPSYDSSIIGLDTVDKNKLFSKPLTGLEVLSKDDEGNPLQIRSSFNGNPVQLLTLAYDSDGDFLSAVVTDV